MIEIGKSGSYLCNACV